MFESLPKLRHLSELPGGNSARGHGSPPMAWRALVPMWLSIFARPKKWGAVQQDLVARKNRRSSRLSSNQVQAWSQDY